MLENDLLIENIELFGTRILVKLVVKKQTGGLIIPSNSAEKPNTGLVIKVGNGKLFDKDNSEISVPVNVGDLVWFQKWSGNNEMTIQNEAYVLMNLSDILGVIKGGK